MKNYINGLKHGLGIATILGLFLGIGYFVIHARSGTTATAGDKLTAAKWNELSAKVDAINSIPAGSIVAFNSSTCPTGRKPADGTNSTVDLRGEFIRGWDSTRTVGDIQNATEIALNIWTNGGNYYPALRYVDALNPVSNWNIGGQTSPSDVVPQSNGIIRETSNGGTYQTLGGAGVASFRPRNVSLLYCVKN